MGLIRKSLAVGTFGLVRGSSKKQRVAKAQLEEMRKQTEVMRQAVGDTAVGDTDVERRGQAALARSRELQRLAKEKASVEPKARVGPAKPVEPVKHLPSEGWYPDPDREHLLRWWDGHDWTDRTAPRV
jgi:hypothetical protein